MVEKLRVLRVLKPRSISWELKSQFVAYPTWLLRGFIMSGSAILLASASILDGVPIHEQTLISSLANAFNMQPSQRGSAIVTFPPAARRSACNEDARRPPGTKHLGQTRRQLRRDFPCSAQNLGILNSPILTGFDFFFLWLRLWLDMTGQACSDSRDR
jgi:hypothetical protein